MNNVTAYEKLYTNLKNRFTVVNDNCEYSLGDYMLLKAGEKKKEASNLPAVRTNSSNEKAVTAFFRYVNDKLTVKAPPVKDKIIRTFPFRTSIAALLSALLVCTLVVSYGSITTNTASTPVQATIEVNEAENEMYETNFEVK
jgi:hypothetical protein